MLYVLNLASKEFKKRMFWGELEVVSESNSDFLGLSS